MEKLDKFIKELSIYAHENFIPIVRENTLQKLLEVLKKENYKNLLEIGTAIGYSGIRMLAENSKFILTTIEKDEKRYLEAKANFQNTNLNDRVELILGDAEKELKILLDNGRKFDFIFLDGPKGQYIRYLPTLKKLLNKGGTLFADNVLLGGLIKDESRVNHKNRTMFNRMKEFVNTILNDNDFDSQIYEIDDGFIIGKLKNSIDD